MRTGAKVVGGGYSPHFRLWPISLALSLGLVVGAQWMPTWGSGGFLLSSGALLLLVVLLRYFYPRGRRRSVFLLLLISVLLLGMGRGVSEQIIAPPLEGSAEAHFFSLCITSPPKDMGWTTGYQARLLAVGAEGDWLKGAHTVALQFRKEDSASFSLHVGDSLLARGYYKHSLRETNPHAFRFSQWQALHGIAATVSVFRGQWTRYYISPIPKRGGVLAGIRKAMLARLSAAGVTGEEYSLVAAMTLADKTGLDRDLKAQFSRAGLAHILVLSGLHIGFVYLLLSIFCLFIPKRNMSLRWLRALLPIAGIWVFVAICGWGLSLLRAAIMISFVAIGQIGHSRLHPLDSLLLAAAAILLLLPKAIADLGFQLSFSALWGIFCFTEPISAPIQPRTKVGVWLLGVLSASLAAQLGTLPFTLHHFGTLPLLAILSNLFAIPLAGLIVSLGLLIELLPLGSLLGGALGWCEALATRLLICLTGTMNQVPGVQLEGVRIGMWGMLCLLGVSLLMGLYLWTNRVALRHLGLALLAFSLPLLFWQGYTRTYSSELAVLYDNPQPLVVLKEGRRLYVEGDTSRRAYGILSDYSEDIYGAEQISLRERTNGQKFSSSPNAWYSELGERRVVCLYWSESLQYRFVESPYPVDIVVVRGKPGRGIANLLRAWKPKELVLATSRSRKGEQWLRGFAQAAGVPCRSVKQEGACLFRQ